MITLSENDVIWTYKQTLLHIKLACPRYNQAIINTARFFYYDHMSLCYTTPPRTEMDYCGGLILRPEQVYCDCGPLVESGCMESEFWYVGGHVQLGSFGGCLWGLGITAWTGWSRSTWAHFSLSTEMVSDFPLMSTKKVFEPDWMTLNGP